VWRATSPPTTSPVWWNQQRRASCPQLTPSFYPPMSPHSAHADESCQRLFADHVDDRAPFEVRLGLPKYFVSNRSDVPLPQQNIAE
jgi:hypothetical protein